MGSHCWVMNAIQGDTTRAYESLLIKSRAGFGVSLNTPSQVDPRQSKIYCGLLWGYYQARSAGEKNLVIFSAESPFRATMSDHHYVVPTDRISFLHLEPNKYMPKIPRKYREVVQSFPPQESYLRYMMLRDFGRTSF